MKDFYSDFGCEDKLFLEINNKRYFIGLTNLVFPSSVDCIDL